MPGRPRWLFRHEKQQDASSSNRARFIDLGQLNALRFSVNQQWHDLLIAGPTQSQVGTRSNDFPGLYYYDPRTQTEYVLMFGGPINWQDCTLERRIASITDDDGTVSPHLVVGLFSENELDKSVKIRAERRKRQFGSGIAPGERDLMPDQWEAMAWLVGQSFRLLPLDQPGPAHDWTDAASRCLDTLLRLKHKRKDEDRLWLFFETFVTSTQWDSTKKSYRLLPQKEYERSAELLCQAGLSGAILDYCRTEPPRADDLMELGMQLASTLVDFYDERTGIFQNTYPPRGEEWKRGVVDTWYMFHNLYQVLRVSRLETV